MKNYFAVIVGIFTLIGGVGFGYSNNGCCSYHGGIKYISTEGTILCMDETLSSCRGSQGKEICEGVSNYTQSDFGNSSRIINKDFKAKEMFDRIQNSLEELYTVRSKLRLNRAGSLSRILDLSVAKTESDARDRYCSSRDAFILLAQGYIQEKPQRLEEDHQDAEEQATGIWELLKDGDSAFSEKRWELAASYYNQALNIMGRDPMYENTREKVDHAVRIANRQIVLEKATKEREIESAKFSLGDKVKILESLVPIIKSKDQTTQDDIKDLLEQFKLSRDSYTKNIGIYLSYLLR